MSEAIVHARGWGMRHASRQRWALRDLDLTIERGEVVLLCGTSGSGKSTLLHALAGVDRDAEVEGTLANNATVTAYVQQDPDAQIVMARIEDDVAFGPENLGLDAEEIRKRSAQALEVFGVMQPWNRPIDALSGGERQRLALAGAWAMQPDLLLLDEPTSMLDDDGVHAVRTLIALARRAGTTVVLVEHRVNAVVDLVDRVIVLDERLSGPATELFTRHREQLLARGIWVPDYRPAIARTPQIGDEVAHVRTDRVEWGVRRGALSALVGPNGSGKTRALMTLAGLSDRGRTSTALQVHGNYPPDPALWPASAFRGRIAMVFQNPEHQLIHRTVRDELGDDALMERLGLGHLADAEPHTLSGGEQRRLSVGISLASNAQILLLDEPTFGLDLGAWMIVMEEFLRAASSGSAIGVASHDEHLLALADDATILAVDA
jgi:energy-coupling factor transport system ATP-binding protein